MIERETERTESFARNGDEDALRRLDKESRKTELLWVSEEVVEANAAEADERKTVSFGGSRRRERKGTHSMNSPSEVTLARLAHSFIDPFLTIAGGFVSFRLSSTASSTWMPSETTVSSFETMVSSNWGSDLACCCILRPKGGLLQVRGTSVCAGEGRR